jgi:hypothetical protein
MYEGTKAFLIGKKQDLFVKFGQFPCYWIRIWIWIRILKKDPYPGRSSKSGSGSTTLLLTPTNPCVQVLLPAYAGADNNLRDVYGWAASRTNQVPVQIQLTVLCVSDTVVFMS